LLLCVGFLLWVPSSSSSSTSSSSSHLTLAMTHRVLTGTLWVNLMAWWWMGQCRPMDGWMDSIKSILWWGYGPERCLQLSILIWSLDCFFCWRATPSLMSWVRDSISLCTALGKITFTPQFSFWGEQ
jgi:hypothetical protein